MNVLLIGGGGRECALARKISQSPLLDKLYVDSDNPGFPDGVISINSDENVKLDLVVIGPEGPLSNGMTDVFLDAGISVFGPTRKAARLETSKMYAKEIMNELNIPTAIFETFDRKTFIKMSPEISTPCVIKADGLAAGKGVYVCNDFWEKWDAVYDIEYDKIGSAADNVLVEEMLFGKELSIIAICDGERSIMLPSCRDYKRRFDNDEGANTGGMGAICPVPNCGDAYLAYVKHKIVDPVLKEMKSRGAEFRGALYVGLIVTGDGSKVLEFNVRFGDPECQVLMMMIDEDILPILRDAAKGKLEERKIKVKDGASCCIVMCDMGYPEKRSQGEVISLGDDIAGDVFFSGAAKDDEGNIATDGGRILSICSRGEDLSEAIKRAYEDVNLVNFKNMDYRKDIGC